MPPKVVLPVRVTRWRAFCCALAPLLVIAPTPPTPAPSTKKGFWPKLIPLAAAPPERSRVPPARMRTDAPDVAPSETLTSRIPFQLVSRLHEMAQIIELQGADYRREVSGHAVKSRFS